MSVRKQNAEMYENCRLLCYLVVLHLMVTVQSIDTYKRVCYVSRTSFMPISAIPPSLCTHLIFGFAMINDKGSLVPVHDTDVQIYKELLSMKNENPDLRILISVQNGFDVMLTSNITMKNSFAESAVSFLKMYQFDGLDLDWEPFFPLEPSKVSGYAELCLVMKKWLGKSSNTKADPYLLSAALYANITKASYMYNITLLAQIMDFVTLMTYDYHLYIRNKDTITGYNSPLYTAIGEPSYWSVKGTIDFYLKNKMPATKIMMGFPTYGRTYKLANPNQYGLHAPAVGHGDPGPIRKLRGIYTYQDVCYSVKRCPTTWDDTSKVPYLHNGTTWLSFDNIQSATEKCSWLKTYKLGGVGIWAVHMDDFSNMCQTGLFPLISFWKKCLNT